MRMIACVLLLSMVVVSCESKGPTKPAVTDADIELYDQRVVAVPDSAAAPGGGKVAVTDSVKSVDWQGKILNRSRFTVGVGLKLELVASNDSTFYTSTEKIIEIGQNLIGSFTYSETKSQTPAPVLPPVWNWRMKSRVVTFK